MPTTKPRVYTLCGSTRFPDAFAVANMHLSALGHIVVSVGMYGHADDPRGAKFLCDDGDIGTKEVLDELHLRKIDLSDTIFVVNVGGYVGESTRREIAYAISTGKAVEWMFPDAAPQDIPDEWLGGEAVTYIAIKYDPAPNRYSWNGAFYSYPDEAVAATAGWYRSFIGEIRDGKLGMIRWGNTWNTVWRNNELDARECEIVAHAVGLELVTQWR